MKKLFIGQLIGLGLVLGALAGCGDDDDSSGGSNGGSVSGGGTSAKGGGGGASGSATTGGTSAKGGASSTGGGSGTSGGSSSGGRTGTAGGAGGAGAGGESGGGAGGNGGAGGEGGLNIGGEGGASADLRDLSDAQIFKVLDTLNAGEVQQANAAMPKLTVTEVGTFAQTMVSDHTQARTEVQNTAESLGVTPAASSVEAELRSQSDSVVASFLASQDTSLDDEYISSQVSAHRDALKLITHLEGTADASQLKQLLSTLHGAVQTHYQMAVQLQNSTH